MYRIFPVCVSLWRVTSLPPLAYTITMIFIHSKMDPLVYPYLRYLRYYASPDFVIHRKQPGPTARRLGVRCVPPMFNPCQVLAEHIDKEPDKENLLVKFYHPHWPSIVVISYSDLRYVGFVGGSDLAIIVRFLLVALPNFGLLNRGIDHG
jgi:hypothetical protein